MLMKRSCGIVGLILCLNYRFSNLSNSSGLFALAFVSKLRLPRITLTYPIRFAKMTDSDFDDWGLEDFDVDAAVANRKKSCVEYSASTTGATGLSASQNNSWNVHNTPPFGSDSKFSSGDKTNPNEFVAINPYTNQHFQKRAQNATDSNPSPMKRQAMSSHESTQRNQQTIPPRLPEKIPIETQKSLEQTLRKHFGHESFRPGQLPILHSILQKRDAAVFWSTGSGKSICYQIPPLHTGKIALIVSPLISLMEDQVAKLNGLVAADDNGGDQGKKDVAVFLGSGQRDASAEQRALNGDYPLVYCTPEKLVSGDGWFLNQMGHLHNNKGKMDGLCLVASKSKMIDS